MGTNEYKMPILWAFRTFFICPLTVLSGDKRPESPFLWAFKRGQNLSPYFFHLVFGHVRNVKFFQFFVLDRVCLFELQ